MVKIEFYSWEKGMRKIQFIRFLNEYVGLSLTESKQIKDDITYGKNVQIEVENISLAKNIIIKSKEYGVNCRIVNPVKG